MCVMCLPGALALAARGGGTLVPLPAAAPPPEGFLCPVVLGVDWASCACAVCARGSDRSAPPGVPRVCVCVCVDVCVCECGSGLPACMLACVPACMLACTMPTKHLAHLITTHCKPLNGVSGLMEATAVAQNEQLPASPAARA